ncbi:MAG: hypothetical protein GF401_01655, partial [Chitinivibrionales bacterium]|nr:hypothetical protein [Chitinivibrionales bacterium]
KNFSWIIPDTLAGSALPGGAMYLNDEYALSDLRELYELGVRRLISLHPMDRHYGELCENSGLIWTDFPIDDFSVPREEDAFKGMIESAVSHMRSKVPVCVHCYAGVGRTGMVLACIVGLYSSLAPAAAIRKVRETRPAIDTPEQEKFVYDFLTYRK